ncbi:MAG: hypothetical protein ACE5KM_03000 [Planctomycetaceae bacterium]
MTRPAAFAAVAFLSMGPWFANAQNKPESRQLVSLVDENVGLCIELREVSRQSKRFAKSELFRRLEASTVVQSLLRGKQYRQLQKVTRDLKTSGTPVEQLLEGLFGDSVVLAVYPQKGRQPAGVLLTRARGRKSLDDALDLWDRLEPGSITVPLKYDGKTYHRRRGGKSGHTLYYARLDEVFVLSDRDAMIHKVLRLQGGAKSSTDKPLAESSRYLAARRSLAGDPVLTAFLNPRAWDDAMASQRSKDAELLLMFWKNCRWAMAGVRLDGGFALQAVLDYDGRAMPPAWQRYVRAASQKSDLFNRMPAAALVAYAGRYDPALLRSLLAGARQQPRGSGLQQARAAAWAVAGFDIVKDLMPQLRPAAGCFVVARHDADENTPPFHGLIALAVAKPENGKAAVPRRDRLVRGLSDVLQFLTKLYNLTQIKKDASTPQFATVKSRRIATTRITWVDRVAGFQPGFALAPQYLLFASSPDLIAGFLAQKDRLVDDARFRDARARFFPDDNQVLYVNAARLRRHLTKHGRSMRKLLTRIGASPDDLPLKSAMDLLGVFDGAFLAARITESRIRITLGVTATPAK